MVQKIITKTSFRKYNQILFSILFILQIALCCKWVVNNWGIIPSYGDSEDYILRSNPLLIHNIRPFTLPLIIRFSQALGGKEYFPYILFCIQIALTFMSVWFTVCILLPNISKKIRGVITILVGTNPLIMHFSHAIVPDAFAMSLTLLTLCFLWELCTKRLYTTNKYIYILCNVILFIYYCFYTYFQYT